VKRFLLGLVSCLIGALLCTANWLGAAAYLSHVTEWDTQRGKMASAWDAVGRQPLAVGIALLAIGVLLIGLSFVPLGPSQPES
jgi:hypothetical protein